jgi:hypothetical protein
LRIAWSDTRKSLIDYSLDIVPAQIASGGVGKCHPRIPWYSMLKSTTRRDSERVTRSFCRSASSEATRCRRATPWMGLPHILVKPWSADTRWCRDLNVRAGSRRYLTDLRGHWVAGYDASVKCSLNSKDGVVRSHDIGSSIPRKSADRRTITFVIMGRLDVKLVVFSLMSHRNYAILATKQRCMAVTRTTLKIAPL